MIPKLPPSWHPQLKNELEKPYFKDLINFLENEKAAGKTIFPKEKDFFKALELCPLENVKVVIIGQDPYHGEDQANGLSFSVPDGIKIPPSLRNIYKEIHQDLKIEMPMSGNLTQWAKQGVLLLNTVLSVEMANAGSHQKKGWEQFTDKIVEVLNQQESIVFLLWGIHAQKKAANIDEKRHLALKAPHPSPLSAHRGFLGCGHFSKTNEYLIAHKNEPIHWKL